MTGMDGPAGAERYTGADTRTIMDTAMASIITFYNSGVEKHNVERSLKPTSNAYIDWPLWIPERVLDNQFGSAEGTRFIAT